MNLLAYDYIPTADGGRPVCLVRLNANNRDVDIPGVFAPHLPHSRIAPVWAEAVELSSGQPVSLRFVNTDGRPWGDDYVIVPEVDPDLDPPHQDEPQDSLTPEAKLRFLTEGIAIGNDFLQRFTVLLDGGRGVAVVAEVPPEG